MLGRKTWAQLEQGSCLISIAVIYAQSSSPWECTFLWHQLKALLPDGQWILMGDFNMMGDPQDSLGPSSLINDSQLETWHMLKTRFDLVDAYHLVWSFVGSRFTRSATHSVGLD